MMTPAAVFGRGFIRRKLYLGQQQTKLISLQIHAKDFFRAETIRNFQSEVKEIILVFYTIAYHHQSYLFTQKRKNFCFFNTVIRCTSRWENQVKTVQSVEFFH